MHTDPLVKMANQIAAFFDAMPDRAEALEGVALHIRKFWVPRMRQRFLAHVDSGGAGLHPLVLQAVQAHRAVLGISAPGPSFAFVFVAASALSIRPGWRFGTKLGR